MSNRDRSLTGPARPILQGKPLPALRGQGKARFSGLGAPGDWPPPYRHLLRPLFDYPSNPRQQLAEAYISAHVWVYDNC